MADVKRILAEVVARITPTQRPPEVDATLDAINAQLRKRKIRAKASLGGSFAKDTWLVGDHDVDIFVAFDLSYKDKPLSDILAPALAFLKPTRVHGSRDYFQIEDHFMFEIIPVLAIKKPADAQNITDFSLRHVTWVNARSKRLKDDIRLAKKFCKAQRVYGAESYIRGFSGHVVDLLVVHCRGFMPLLRAAAKWTPKTVIDTENAHKGKTLLVLNKSKTEGPLVVVDPVQPERNAAASLMIENYDRFVHAAKMFLARPSLGAFERQSVDFAKMAKRGSLVLVSAQPMRASEDVAGTKLLKLFEHVKTTLVEQGFTLSNAAWDWDKKHKALLWFVTKEATLPKTREVTGPPVRLSHHAAAFKKKYRRVKTSKGKLVAIVPITLRTPIAEANAASHDPLVKDKARAIKVMPWSARLKL